MKFIFLCLFNKVKHIKNNTKSKKLKTAIDRENDPTLYSRIIVRTKD